MLKSTKGKEYSTEFDPGGRLTRVTYPGNFSESALEVVYSYNDANQLTEIIARNLTDDAAMEIYAIEYRYDENGRRTRQTVWDARAAWPYGTDWPRYEAHYTYDNRSQLLEEKYLHYNTGTSRMDEYRKTRYEYDNGGSMTK